MQRPLRRVPLEALRLTLEKKKKRFKPSTLATAIGGKCWEWCGWSRLFYSVRGRFFFVWEGRSFLYGFYSIRLLALCLLVKPNGSRSLLRVDARTQLKSRGYAGNRLSSFVSGASDFLAPLRSAGFSSLMSHNLEPAESRCFFVMVFYLSMHCALS